MNVSMIKKFLKIKGLLALILVTAFSMSTMGAVVSDNDGAAFVTKAEFDALKKNFKSQIESYNESIDNKVDGAIAAYLAGIKFDRTTTLDITNVAKRLTFVDGPQWPVRYRAQTISSASSWWGGTRLSGISGLWLSTSTSSISHWIGFIPLSSYPFSYAYSQYYINTNFTDNNAESASIINIVGGTMGMFYKVAVQDDYSEFWYAAVYHSVSYSATVSKSVAMEHLRPWGLVNKVSGYYILKDFTPFLGLGTGAGTLYGATNYFIDQVTWEFADESYLRSFTYSLYLYWSGRNLINLAMNQYSSGTFRTSAYHKFEWDRNLTLSKVSLWIGGLREWDSSVPSARVFSVQNTIFGGVVSGWNNIPVLHQNTRDSFAGPTFAPYTWGSISQYNIYGSTSIHQVEGHSRMFTSAIIKFGAWASWSSTSARVSIPQAYSYLSLMSFRNAILFNAGYSDLGLCDGLPLCEVMDNGYAEINIKCSTWRVARLKSRSGTSFSWLNSVRRSYDSDKEWKSTLLHISTSKFNNVAGNSSTLKLCDSEGVETSAYAQSIGNSHSYNYNLSYNASASRSENEYNVWKVYVPVKIGDTIYVKFEPKDPYGRTGVQIVDASVVVHSD